MNTMTDYYQRNFYDDDQQLCLLNPKAHLEMCCVEWDDMEEEKRVCDLGFLVEKGFDLVRFVNEYYADRPNNGSYIARAFCTHIGAIYQSEILYVALSHLWDDDKVTIEQLVQLFVRDVPGVTTFEIKSFYNDNVDIIPIILPHNKIDFVAIAQFLKIDTWPKIRLSANKIEHLRENEIFVFGSNKQGAHGGGAARFAMNKFGAEWGVGEGLTGQCYALPTMEGNESFKQAVKTFLECAKAHPELTFLVTAVGCGIAGYAPEQVKPWFEEAKALPNVYLPESFM